MSTQFPRGRLAEIEADLATLQANQREIITFFDAATVTGTVSNIPMCYKGDSRNTAVTEAASQAYFPNRARVLREATFLANGTEWTGGTIIPQLYQNGVQIANFSSIPGNMTVGTSGPGIQSQSFRNFLNLSVPIAANLQVDMHYDSTTVTGGPEGVTVVLYLFEE